MAINKLRQFRAWRLGLTGGILLVATLWTGGAFANPCVKTITNCEPQVMSGINYSGWETKGWAYYCSGSHPYYWGRSTYEFSNKCFSVAEQTFRTDQSKLNVTVTNWCFKKETLVLTLACSSDKPGFPCFSSDRLGCPANRDPDRPPPFSLR
jgi:hypothetical protein